MSCLTQPNDENKFLTKSKNLYKKMRNKKQLLSIYPFRNRDKSLKVQFLKLVLPAKPKASSLGNKTAGKFS